MNTQKRRGNLTLDLAIAGAAIILLTLVASIIVSSKNKNNASSDAKISVVAGNDSAVKQHVATSVKANAGVSSGSLPAKSVDNNSSAAVQNTAGVYGDYQFRSDLDEHRDQQNADLMKKALENEKRPPEERSSLCLSVKEVEALKKTGNLIY